MSPSEIKPVIWKLLKLIGENPDRQGLLDTPNRVAEMYKELFRGYDPTTKPKVSVFNNGCDGVIYDEMITDTGDFYSHCEHHMVPFFGTYWFAYIPDKNGKIIGLSKVARIIDWHCARLQIQERLVHEIVEDLWNELTIHNNPGLRTIEPIAMGLVMKGEHLCKTMRGVRKKGEMTTTKLKGAFLTNIAARNEFLSFVR